MLKMGDAIRGERERAGLSQTQLAEQLAVTRQAVSKWERNLSYPDADMLVQLSTVLQCDVRVLLGIKQKREWGGWLRLKMQDLEDVLTVGNVKKMTAADIVQTSRQYIEELLSMLEQEHSVRPEMLDIIDVLHQVDKKLDAHKNPAALVNRMINYLRIRASAGRIVFPKPQEALIGELAWIGNSAGWNGAYRADFTDKSQFYGFMENYPRH
jgi:transcriptional regulator with XRE-family HTH domain